MTYSQPPGNYPPPPPGSGGQPPAGYGAVPGAAPALPKEAYASWGVRVVGYVIDILPVLVLYGIGFAVVTATSGTSCTDGQCTGPSPIIPLLVNGVLWLAILAYSIWNRWYRQGTTGQTIGKSAMKIKLVSEATGQPIGFGMAFVRDLAHIVDSLICYIGWLFPLWDAKRQTIADKLVSTVVLPAS